MGREFSVWPGFLGRARPRIAHVERFRARSCSASSAKKPSCTARSPPRCFLANDDGDGHADDHHGGGGMQRRKRRREAAKRSALAGNPSGREACCLLLLLLFFKYFLFLFF